MDVVAAMTIVTIVIVVAVVAVITVMGVVANAFHINNAIIVALVTI